VVDLTTVVSGPYATQLLADFGADVVKVEAPAGDVARDLGPSVNPGMGAVYLNCNRGKRSVVLDLSTADGRRALKELCDTADVFVENMRPAAAARCGADAATLRAGHPELIHCSIHGFAADGIRSELPAYDDIVQSVSGLAGSQAWLHGEPAYTASAVADKVSSLYAAFAIAAALRQRAVDGVGVAIEVPMAETLASFGLVEHLWGRSFVPPRGDARYPRMSSPLRRPFPTADGYLSVVVYTDRDWDRFFALIGRPELAADERFATLRRRTEHLDELYRLIGAHLALDTTASWFARLTEAGIPAAPYNTVDDLFTDEHFAAVGLMEETVHPTEGPLLTCPLPVRLDGARPPLGTPAPRLGADTDAVLAELGITPPGPR